MKSELHDRINRIINTAAFERTLEAEGLCLFDFQAEWCNHASFDALPDSFKKAILAGEQELASNAVAV